MKRKNKKDWINLYDLFSIRILDEEVESGLKIEVDVLPKGVLFITEMKKKDPKWSEQKYLEDIINQAMEAYVKENEKSDRVGV